MGNKVNKISRIRYINKHIRLAKKKPELFIVMIVIGLFWLAVDRLDSGDVKSS